MYFSLRWYSLSGSYDYYKIFSFNLSLYRVFTKVIGRRYYNNTFLFYYIASSCRNEDVIRSITSTETDEILLIYNIYNTFLIRDTNVLLDTYPLFYLNTPNKYKPKDLIKIDLIAQTDGVRKIKEFHIGKNFVGYFYNKFLNNLNYAFVFKSKDMSELIDKLGIINNLSSTKSKSYIYLEHLAKKLSNILKILNSYLNIFDFKDVLDIVKKESNPVSYAFVLYLNVYVFYNTSSIVIDIDFYLKYTGEETNQNFKAFLSLDKSFYVYKDINGVIKTGYIDNKDLEDNKKDIFKSDYFIQKRYNKINMI